MTAVVFMSALRPLSPRQSARLFHFLFLLLFCFSINCIFHYASIGQLIGTFTSHLHVATYIEPSSSHKPRGTQTTSTKNVPNAMTWRQTKRHIVNDSLSKHERASCGRRHAIPILFARRSSCSSRSLLRRASSPPDSARGR